MATPACYSSRAVLTNHTGAVQRSGGPGLDLADGKLNNGVLISAAAAIDVIWRGSKPTPVSKNKAVDYVVIDAQGAPFRSDPAAAEKAGKGVFVQAKAVSAEATKLVRAQKDEALVALLSAPWGSVAYLPATAPAAMDLQPAQLPAESPVTGAKRGREQSATPIVPPPPPAIVSPGLPPPSREEILEAQQDFISTVIHGDVLERSMHTRKWTRSPLLTARVPLQSSRKQRMLRKRRTSAWPSLRTS